ncbi:MAG: hypothetical protein ACR2NN_17610 [Bryobacteraceae bacterium]
MRSRILRIYLTCALTLLLLPLASAQQQAIPLFVRKKVNLKNTYERMICIVPYQGSGSASGPIQVHFYMMGIPAKANTDSGRNANGIPGRRRTDLGA